MASEAYTHIQPCMNAISRNQAHALFNPFTATLFFRAWHGLEKLVLLTSNTVKYLEIIYKYVPHALRNRVAYHN